MVKGTVVSGLGEGAYYMNKYARYFKEQLGKDFFPGTLNVQVSVAPTLRNPILISPDEEDLYTVRCYKMMVNGNPAYLVVPEVTEHPDTLLEIIAKDNLREKLKIKDGNEVEIEFIES